MERFLENLVKRHCQFHIAFFEGMAHSLNYFDLLLRNPLENAELCIPSGSHAKHRSRYLLARSAIKRHLTIHLPSALPTIIVNTFSSVDSPEFNEYLQASPIHFVMTHDGANKKQKTKASKANRCTKILLRAMIWHFNARNLNVALINQIEFRDSKVFTMIVESFTRRAKQKLLMTSNFVHEIKENRNLMAEVQEGDGRDQYFIEDVDIGELAEISVAEELGESSFLTAYAVSLLLNEGDCDIFLASAFVLHGIIAKHVSLSQRRLPIISFDKKFERNIDEFLAIIFDLSRQLLEDPKWSEVMEIQEAVADIMDLADGRLFRATIQAICDNSFQGVVPEAAEDDWRTLHYMVNQLSGQDLSIDGSLKPEAFKTMAIKDDHDENSEILSVLPFSSPVFDEHLKCIHVTADTSIQYRVGAMKLYRETTHWHNYRKPLNVKAPTTQIVSKWRYVPPPPI